MTMDCILFVSGQVGHLLLCLTTGQDISDQNPELVDPMTNYSFTARDQRLAADRFGD